MNFDVENAIVITNSNDVYRCIGNKNNLISIIEVFLGSTDSKFYVGYMKSAIAESSMI